VNILLTGSLHTLFMTISYLQVVVHMVLIKIKVPPNASIFFGALLSVAAFDALPTDDVYNYIFDINDEPISENFKELGYETRQFMYNTGSLSFVMLLFPPFILMIFIFSLMPCKSVKKYGRKQKKKMFFSRIFMFFEESYMILATSLCINLTNMVWVHEKTARAFGTNINTVITGVFTVVLIGLPIGIAVFYSCYFKKLTESRRINQKYGAFINNLNVAGMDKLVILYPVLGQVRKMILAFTVVYLQDLPNFSIFSINF